MCVLPESSVSSACGPRFTGSMASFCTRAIARRCRDCHKSWISVLRVRWQWSSGPVYESMWSFHPLQTCLHPCSRRMLSSVDGRVSIMLLRVSRGWFRKGLRSSRIALFRSNVRRPSLALVTAPCPYCIRPRPNSGRPCSCRASPCVYTGMPPVRCSLSSGLFPYLIW